MGSEVVTSQFMNAMANGGGGAGGDIVETNREGFLKRLGDSFKGIAFGLFMIFGAIALLVWNEYNAIQTYRSLNEGESVVQSLSSAATVDSAYQGKLVHLVADVTTNDTITDSIFGVTPSPNTLKLERRVEMYQWVETSSTSTKTNTGGSTTTQTTYSYHKEWRSDLVNSGSFKDSASHRNPTSMPYSSQSFSAEPIFFGAFIIPRSMVGRISWYESFDEPLQVSNITDAALRNATQVVNMNTFYVGKDPFNAQTGDIRVNYRVVRSQTASIVAQQMGNTFAPYPTKSGRSVSLLQSGTYSAEAMFQDARNSAKATVWILRFVGFLIMYFGFVMIAQPLAVFSDIIPVLGSCVGGAIACIMLPVALSLSTLIVGLAWVAVRPGLALGIIVAIVGGSFAYYYFFVRRDEPKDGTKQAEVDEESVPVKEAYAVPVYDPEIHVAASP